MQDFNRYNPDRPPIDHDKAALSLIKLAVFFIRWSIILEVVGFFWLTINIIQHHRLYDPLMTLGWALFMLTTSVFFKEWSMIEHEKAEHERP